MSDRRPELFEFRDITKHYPILGGVFKRQKGTVRVLNGIDLKIISGDTFGLVGESGCGKSTLAKLMMKLEDPTSGDLLYMGKPVEEIHGRDKKAYYRQLQMIFQDPFSSLNPRLKIKDIVGEMIRIQGVGKKEERSRVIQILNRVGLGEEALDRYPHEFSGGQRQRIAIARALIVEPSLLIADEPVSALDLSLQVKTLKLLKSLKADHNLTIFIISHDLKKVAHFCTTVAVMYLGRVVEIIPGDRLLKDCKHPYTEALISSIPVTDPRQRTEKKAIIRGEVPSPVNLPPGCAFHKRCEKRREECRLSVPELKPIRSDEHKVACFLYR